MVEMPVMYPNRTSESFTKEALGWNFKTRILEAFLGLLNSGATEIT